LAVSCDLTPVSHETLKSFRRNAVHVRQALDVVRQGPGRVDMAGGVLQDQARIEHYKRLSIPVRRALNAGDRASFVDALAAIKRPDLAAGVPDLSGLERAWQGLQQELETTVGLGGAKVPRRQILAEWLEAAAFYDRLDRNRAYEKLIEQYGLAAEAIGSEFTEAAARVILQLDALVAAALGEPAILPPPAKTPPPPPDPDRPWWKRILG
jgi:hypothetical protein